MNCCGNCNKFKCWSDEGVESEGGFCEDVRNASGDEETGFEYAQVAETDSCDFHSEGSDIEVAVHHTMSR
jgi:hypothetical protein